MVRAALLVLVAAGAHAAAPDIVIEASLDPARVYAGGESKLTLRLLRAEGVTYSELQPPDLGDAAQIVPGYGARSFRETRSGVSYFVLERNFSVIPRRAGRLAVRGGLLTGLYRGPQVALRHGSTLGPMLWLQVLAPRAEPWLPARHLTLKEAWSADPSALASGTPVSRTLTVQADSVSADRLPVLEVPPFRALRAHYDRPEAATAFGDYGLTARRVQRIVLIPVDDGEVELPEIRVPWWDVDADVARVAVLPARRLQVSASLPEPSAEEPAIAPLTLFRWAAALVGMISAAALWRHVRNQARRDALARLRYACRRNNPRAARDAMIEWWKATRPGERVPLVTRMREGAGERVQEELGKLNAALYAGRAWDGGSFWQAMRRARPGPAARRAPSRSAVFRLQ